MARLRLRRAKTAKPDRVLMAHGPIVHGLVVALACSLVLSAAGFTWLGFVVAGKADKASTRSAANAAQIAAVNAAGRARLEAVQESRRDSSIDSCRALRRVILAATPPQRRKQARTFIAKAGLSDCEAYARRLTALPPGVDR